LVSDAELKNLLSKKEFSNTDKILFCLAADPLQPRQVSDIRGIGIRCGLRAIKTWNISASLNRVSDRAIKTNDGWELTTDGENAIRTIIGASPIATVSPSLRKVAATINDEDTKNFVLEAIACFEAHHYRASVVLSWVGAVSVLYDHILNDSSLLASVNAEAKRRNNDWKDAKSKDDLGLMKERTFLEILVKLSVIGKSIKTELLGCLNLRNGSGHPNSMVIGEHKVSAHIEFLVQNVYSKFQRP